MRKQRPGFTALIALVVLLAVIVGAMVFVLLRYHIVDFKLYPKNVSVLDLTEKEISVGHYEKIRSVLPDCTIHWNVPFQGNVVENDTTHITVTTLTAEDALALSYLPQLTKVDARECRDYNALMYLRQLLPQVEVDYRVLISGIYYGPETTEVKVDSITKEEILSMEYLPLLENVVACGGPEQSDYSQLRNYCKNTGKSFSVSIGGQKLAQETAAALTLENAKEEEIYLLQYVQRPESLHFLKPQAKPETLLALRQQYPNTAITWEVELAGELYPDTTTEVDLSKMVIEDLAEVEQTMAYFPDAEMLILGLCGVDNPEWGNSKMDGKLAVSAIDNEEIAQYRDRVMDQYKVVWTIRLGPHIALRTDADNFMPNHFGVGRLPDDYAHNLRYCIDMVCLDLGHMTVTHIDFVQYMPKLKYLILAWTNVKYIEPIRNCKELIFLELDNSAIRDISPLVDCTKLEDLNIGNAWPNVDGILTMTWLKNVYMIYGSLSDAWKISQALPDTRVVTTGNATVGGGWRRMQNYYDMRDMLHAPYMN